MINENIAYLGIFVGISSFVVWDYIKSIKENKHFKKLIGGCR